MVRASARAFIISTEALGAIGPTAETASDRLSSAYLLSAAGRTIRDVAALEARARKEKKRAAFAEELASALARLTAKYNDDRTPGGRRFRLLAAVHPAPAKGGSHDKDD